MNRMFLKYLPFGWEDDTDFRWAPEIEITSGPSSSASARRECSKHHNHKHYIEIANLTADDIPSEGHAMRQQLLDCIKSMSKLTCRVQHGNIRGTGFVQRVRSVNKCPLTDCRIAGPHGSVVLTVTSVSSIVAETSSGEREGETSLLLEDFDEQFLFRKVKNIASNDVIGDWCELEFLTHDLTLGQNLRLSVREYESKLKALYNKLKSEGVKENFVAVVGYPHGDKKVVSFGKIHKRREVRKFQGDQQWCEYYYDAPTCPGSGGSSLLIPGQPLAGYGYWFGHPHLHNAYNCRLKQGRSSIGSDQWSDANESFTDSFFGDNVRNTLKYMTHPISLVVLGSLVFYYLWG